MTATPKSNIIESNNENFGLLDIIDYSKTSSSNNKCVFVKINQNGKSILCYDINHNTILYNIAENKFVNISNRKNNNVMEFIDKYEENIAIANQNNLIDIFSGRNGKLITSLKGHKTQIKKIAININKDLIITLSADNCLVWNMKNYELIKRISFQEIAFLNIEFDNYNNLFHLAMNDNTILTFSLTHFEIIAKKQLKLEGNIIHMVSSYESPQLIIAGNFPYFLLYKYKEERIQRFRIPNGSFEIKSLEILPGNLICFIGNDLNFYVVDLTLSNKIILNFNLPYHRMVENFTLSYKSSLIMFLTNMGEIFVYNFDQILSKEANLIQKRKNIGMSDEVLNFYLKPYHTDIDLYSSSKLNNISNNINENKFSVTKNWENNSKLKNSYVSNESNSNINLKHSQSQKSTLKNKENLELDLSKLAIFLKKHGKFPDRQRGKIWSFLLDLPNNIQEFENLVRKGNYSKWNNLIETFNLESESKFSTLKLLCSCLSHHCMLFGETSYLPKLIFPFLQLFSNERLFLFEILLTFLFHWCQHFFSAFPSSPILYLQAIESIFSFIDPELYNVFVKQNIDMIGIFWNSLQHLLSDIFDKDDWVIIIDHLFIYKSNPELLIFIIISYLNYFRTPLLNIDTYNEFNLFFSQIHPIKISKIIDFAIKSMKKTPKSLYNLTFTSFVSLNQSKTYPQFPLYPSYLIEAHSKLREQIEHQTMLLNKQKSKLVQADFLTNQLLNEEKKYKLQQEKLLHIENKQRQELLLAEEKRIKEFSENQLLLRNKRIERLYTLQNAVKESLNSQNLVREQEIEILRQELETKQKINTLELNNRLEEEKLIDLEYKTAWKVNDLIDKRNKEDKMRRIKREMEIEKQEEEHKWRILQEKWRLEDREKETLREMEREKKLKEIQREKEIEDEKIIRKERELKKLEDCFKIEQIERERKTREIMENGLNKNQNSIEKKKKIKKKTAEMDKQKIENNFLEEKKAFENLINKNLKEIENHNEKRIEIAKSQKNISNELDNQQENIEIKRKISEIKKNIESEQLSYQNQRLSKITKELEKQDKIQEEFERNLNRKSKEIKERDENIKKMKEDEENLSEEREKFQLFRNKLKEEVIKMKEFKEKLNDKQEDILIIEPSKYSYTYSDTLNDSNQMNERNKIINENIDGAGPGIDSIPADQNGFYENYDYKINENEEFNSELHNSNNDDYEQGIDDYRNSSCRRKVDLNMMQPQYKSHSNSPDRFEVFEDDK